MGARYLRREKARRCPVHTAVLDACSERLSDHGWFEKEEVVNSLNFEAVSDSIRWDYIMDFLRTEEGGEFVPLAARFFKRHKHSERVDHPERFIATGHGKKTAGYANVELDNGQLAIRHLDSKRRIVNGVRNAAKRYAEELAKRALLPAPADANPALPPPK